MPEWTFITRHAVALSLIAEHPRITALELGSAMGMTERAIRKLIADLNEAGYIRKKKVGRGVHYRINHNLKLRQETHGEVVIGDLLKALGWQSRKSEDVKNSV